jgi:hypothetical protein
VPWEGWGGGEGEGEKAGYGEEAIKEPVTSIFGH